MLLYYWRVTWKEAAPTYCILCLNLFQSHFLLTVALFCHPVFTLLNDRSPVLLLWEKTHSYKNWSKPFYSSAAGSALAYRFTGKNMTEEISGYVSINIQFHFERRRILPIPPDSAPVIIWICSLFLSLLFVNYDTKIRQNSGGFAHSELVFTRHSYNYIEGWTLALSHHWHWWSGVWRKILQTRNSFWRWGTEWCHMMTC